MLSLRQELAELLRQAVDRAELEGLWPHGLRPAVFSLIDTPRSVSGDVSWPGLRTLPQEYSVQIDHLADIIRSSLQLTDCSRFCWRGCAAGFINFAWTEIGREWILRWAAAQACPNNFFALPNELAYAVQRTLWLEKMAEDQGQADLAAVSGEVWAAELLAQEEIALISASERAAWNCAKAKAMGKSDKAAIQIRLLAQEWGSYYERHTLLKGTAAQVRARVALGRAVRAVLLLC
ncbi:MAG: hypothetical protein Q4F00_07235 [bacterium]|nr:hypothetical protein [bacterium]